MQVGARLGILKFGVLPLAEHMCWTSNTQFIIGTGTGEVLQASLLPAGQSDNDLVLVSTIIPPFKRSILAFCHDPIRNFIAISFFDKIQIWCLRLDSKCRHRWVLYNMIQCLENDWYATAMTFFGENNHSLCVVTPSGFITWTYKEKSSFRCYNHEFEAVVTHCVVSLDNLLMAGSTCDRSILIWPLQATGPVISEQQTFDIPTGRSWVEYAESAPLAYFDAETVITADPIGNIYLLSLEGEPKHVFSVGDNYFIHSISMSDQMFSVVVMGPVCTTMLIGFTTNAAIHRRLAKAWEEQDSLPYRLPTIQHVKVTTLAELMGARDEERPDPETSRSFKLLASIRGQ
ncbi:hypothetical protein FS749_006572 [Ceratobasidium sp. UAMH 11750]|nr:hypothetical protein FS749_006572 [Ceratobasidium sp. UAMH 11750]